jgi:lipid II:glycine glycyltransferase (peptidoglycan interpeptide bridge formation enzyme)
MMGKSLFYIPFGPSFEKGDINQEEVFALIVKEIGKLANKENAILLKIEPLIRLPERFLSNFKIGDKNYFLSQYPKRLQPQKTLILDLSKKEHEIFDNFKYRVKYNIRLSQKKGVVVKNEDNYRKEFYQLMKKTSQRDNFRCFSEDYYRKLFQVQSDSLKVRLVAAYYNDKMIAANILVFFNHQAFCLHGASDNDYRALKAPNLLQWEEIKLARNYDCHHYDFWGIDEEKWPGLTYFKKTFGGQELKYPPSLDIILNPSWHRFYQLARKIKGRK